LLKHDRPPTWFLSGKGSQQIGLPVGDHAKDQIQNSRIEAACGYQPLLRIVLNQMN
jgi:hypothetical protein